MTTNSEIESQQRRQSVERWLAWSGPVCLTMAFLVGLKWSWGTWLDIQVDFGRELYVPWRMSEGAVLYRDIAWFHGPLSPYLNAALFTVFGVGLRTMVVANSLIALGVLATLYWLVREIADRQAAVLMGLTFLGALAFSQYGSVGNFNWICPYSHEITHGVALTLGSLVLLHRGRSVPRLWAAATAGVCLGLVFLTKCEVFAAALAGNLASWAAIVCPTQRRGRPAWLAFAAWLLGSVVVLVAAYGLLLLRLPPREALIGLLGGWWYVFDLNLTSNAYYKELMGTSDAWGNLTLALLWALACAAYLGLMLGVARGTAQLQYVPAIIFSAFAGSCLMVAVAPVSWTEVSRPWPILLVAVIAGSAWQLWRQRKSGGLPAVELRLSLAVFALALLLRVLLKTQLHHYGFALAMPAAAIMVAAVWTCLPRRANLSWNALMTFRAGVLGAWLTIMALLIQASNEAFRDKQYQITDAPDAFVSDARAVSIAMVLDDLQQRAGPQDTLLVLPDGIMLNYVTRRINPTPFVHFIPPEIVMHGEQHMLAALQRSPPDWVIFLSRNTREYGAQTFGRDYAQTIAQWLEEHYELVGKAGDDPLGNAGFGATLIRRKQNNGGTPR